MVCVWLLTVSPQQLAYDAVYSHEPCLLGFVVTKTMFVEVHFD